MHRWCWLLLASLLAANVPVHAQEQFQYETDLTAKRRVFDSVGAGFREMRRAANGNYYILTAPSPACLLYTSDAADE